MSSRQPSRYHLPRRAWTLVGALSIALVLLPAPTPAEQSRPSRDRQPAAAPSPGSRPQPGTASAGERGARTGGQGATHDKAAGFERPDAAGARHLNAAQEATLQQLKADLGAIGKGMKSADDEIRALAEDLRGMALEPPDPALVNALATDLAAAMADAHLSPQEMAELSRSLSAVLNSAGLSQAEIEVLIDDIEAVLTASGVGRAEVQAVVRDLQAIAGTAQGSGTAGSRSFGRRRSGGRPR